MRLDRKINEDGTGKYELRNLRTGQVIEDCGPGEKHEFFVIMLKDRHALPALTAYMNSIRPSDPEFAADVANLAQRSGRLSPFCQDPD